MIFYDVKQVCLKQWRFIAETKESLYILDAKDF